MVLYGMKGLRERRQAYDLLAAAAKEHWGLSSLPPMERGEKGKPSFLGEVGREFNLTHSGSLALCALDSAPVGVDIQIVKAWRPSLPGRVCAPEELAWLEAGEDRWARFTQLWALKECRVKYSGEGLTRSIDDIRVPLPANGREGYVLDGLCYRVYQGEGWRAAVCGRTTPPERIQWITPQMS